ncbi:MULTISPECIES: DUF6318 family protein [unclassified Nocardioides]|uniref:DUF6318 family protein n=1 Tax=unclassified Nocardioides TaxID=2615069 RepID=UPI0006F80221|nr:MULTISPECIES: DUF6318 family protein [unclassified Nocardioides]KQY51641.1 hypothetical protein ASD30_19955 [Nocardioides sp. Root140]KRF10957.1 hypothetical protein ASH02_19135 [Nocardioides sp. Soil796]
MTVSLASSARRVLALVLALALVLFAASCSDDDPDSNADPTSTPSDTTTPSPTTSTTADAEPTEPPEPDGMGEDSKRGAELLVRYYWQLVDYAQLTGDVKKLETLARPNCGPCNDGVTALRTIHENGGFIRGGQHTLRSLHVARIGTSEPAAYRVEIGLHSSRQRSRQASGAKLDKVPSRTEQIAFIVSGGSDGSFKIDLWEVEAES